MVCLINIIKLLITFLNMKLCFTGACVDLGHTEIKKHSIEGQGDQWEMSKLLFQLLPCDP